MKCSEFEGKLNYLYDNHFRVKPDNIQQQLFIFSLSNRSLVMFVGLGLHLYHVCFYSYVFTMSVFTHTSFNMSVFLIRLLPCQILLIRLLPCLFIRIRLFPCLFLLIRLSPCLFSLISLFPCLFSKK